MIAANLFDHPAVRVLRGLVGPVRWLIQKAKEPKPAAPPPASPQAIQRGGESQSEEERIRRFLEALGQSKGTPPPKVTTRPNPVRPRIFPNLPPLKTKPPPLPGTVSTRPPPPPLPVGQTQFQRATALDPTFEVQDFGKPVVAEAAVETRPATGPAQLRTRFGSVQDLRSAIVL